MNIRRGLFRLWIVGSVLWLVFVGVQTITQVNDELARRARYKEALVAPGYPLIVSCKDVIGEKGVDYIVRPPDIFDKGMAEAAEQDEPTKVCAYSPAGYRKTHPEAGKFSDAQLFSEIAGVVDTSSPWSAALVGAAFATGLPFLVLVTFFVSGWIFSGFRGSTP